ncbi:MAG TPA: hypothetical protein VFB72_08440 [Verrucomicrobiae bacterium]|nr:hypothetical protein [Verrucomicrobiae bacterium]
MNIRPFIPFTVIVGVALLVSGYTRVLWFEKVEEAHEFAVDKAVWKAEQEERLKYPELHAHDFTDEQLKQFERLHYLIEGQRARIVGAVQYCAGWILLGIAGAAWTLAKPEQK